MAPKRRTNPVLNFRPAARGPRRVAVGAKGRPERKNPEAPGLARKVMNLAGAALQVARRGTLRRTAEQRQECLAICAQCPFRIEGKRGLSCSICGCHIRFKNRLAAWECPKGFWPKVTPGEGTPHNG